MINFDTAKFQKIFYNSKLQHEKIDQAKNMGATQNCIAPTTSAT
jgi:hypothetical protein